MSNQVNEKIKRVINNRRKRLPLIEKRIEQWNDVVSELRRLEGAVDNLIEYKELSEDFKTVLQRHNIRDLKDIAKKNIDNFEKVFKRVKRPTVNIGVSGQARVGKSTLLQTIAGLTDDHIPTGKGDPVTAVRSRIFHSPNRRAIIKFHSYLSFRENILIPYHNELDFGTPPLSLDEYRKHNYSVSDKRLNEWDSRKQSLYKRLKDMHDALPSYCDDLHGQKMIKDLSELRELVAYPTGEQEKEKNCPRRYLAVQDAKIECEFPKLDVKNIGLIDLPGMGEIDVEAQTRHVQGLQDDVDLVLLIKRPIEGMAYWRDEDARTVGYLDQARGVIEDKKDYVMIVSNEGECDEELIDKMHDSIHRNANLGVNEQFFKILRTDAKSEDSVYANIMNPVLEHLAERLTEMDHNIFMHAIESSKTESRNISNSLDDLRKDIQDNVSYASDHERLDELTEKLHKNLAKGLGKIVSDYFNLARSEDEDIQFMQAIHKIEDDIRLWIGSGLGSKDKQEWITNAVDTMNVPGGSGGFAEDEFNRIRVHISHQFSELDNYLEGKVKQLLKRIEEVMFENMGTLLSGLDTDLLLHLKKLFDEAMCNTFSNALNDILNLEIKYRTYLHPRIRRCLDELKCQAVTVSKDGNGAEKLNRILSEKAEFAVGESRNTILKDANIVPSILHAACEQFDDALIRSGSAKKEFKRFGRSYQNEIWPEEFSGMGSENARVSKVIKISASIKNALHAMENANV